MRIIGVPDDRKEAEFVVEEIAAHRSSGNLPWEHFAVIYRMNAQSRLFEEALRKRKIPYRLIGGKSFFERREIKDVTAYITVLLNSSDDPSLLRIITARRAASARRRWRRRWHSAWRNARASSTHCRTQNFSRRARSGRARPFALLWTPSARREFASRHRARSMLRFFPRCSTRAVTSTICSASCKTPDEAMNREGNVREILRAMGEHQKRSRDGMQGFLDEVSLDREREEDKDDDARGVTLITMHAAKGLEFPHVFLIGAEDGILPHERSKTEGTVDEERRLFYVGITRAMKTLFITWCRARTKFGSAMHCLPSPFIKEMAGDQVVEESYDEIMSRPMEEEDITAQFARLRAQLAG